MGKTLEYDDSAASVFATTLLLVYLIPASIYIVRRLVWFGCKTVRTAPATSTARSADEAKKQRVLEKLNADLLWTNFFKGFVLATAIAALIFVTLLLRSSGQAELAQYDPYEVRSNSAAPRFEAAEGFFC